MRKSFLESLKGEKRNRTGTLRRTLSGTHLIKSLKASMSLVSQKSLDYTQNYGRYSKIQGVVVNGKLCDLVNL